MVTKYTPIASIKSAKKRVTISGVLTKVLYGKYDAGFGEEPEDGYVISDGTGSIEVGPFIGAQLGKEYTLKGEVVKVGPGQLALIYPTGYVNLLEVGLEEFNYRFISHNPHDESPFTPLIAEKKRQDQIKESEKRKMLIIIGAILAGVIFWWFVIYKGGPATAICNDGWTSHSRHNSGTCSDHGGVQQWLNSPSDTSTQ